MTTTPQRTLPFPARPAIVGMVHVGALPGTPRSSQGVAAIADAAAAEARLLDRAGVDAISIENMHDLPYLRREVGPEIVAAMTTVGLSVRAVTELPLGVQVLAGANRAALAVAQACGASFIRAEGFVFAHVADEGLMAEADAGSLLRYRRAIGAEQVAIWADIKKKHASHALTADVDLAETAHAAAFFGADAVVVTGRSTGEPTDVAELKTVRAAVELPVAVGSGASVDNLAAQWPYADAIIVGSALKRDGLWSNPIDPARLTAFMQEVAALRA